MHDTRSRIPDQPGKPGLQSLGNRLGGASPQKGPGGGLQPLADRYNLIRSLALTENNLGLTLAELAVVVDPGKGEIFKGKVPQLLERRGWGNSAGGNLGKESFDLVGGHATWATGSRYSRKIASASPIDSIWKRRCLRALDPCRPRVYQPRCLRNSMTVRRVSP